MAAYGHACGVRVQKVLRVLRFDSANGQSNKRKAILNFSFSLEGNAAKRQRVYEGKNDNDAPLPSLRRANFD